MRIIPSNDALRAVPPGSVFVPTMGALHAGHASLISRAAHEAQVRGVPCVVSIFVNPTQFNEHSDFQRYPRTLSADAALAHGAGADVLWTPRAEEIYPPNLSVPVPPLPPVACEPGLEDAARPGHFAGVAQVVARLFDLLRPGAAVFGEKDWQQFQLVRALVRRRGDPIEIIGAPTIREADGLAMSSRNRFLTPDERSRAALVSKALREAAREADPAHAEVAMQRVLRQGNLRIEYAAARDAERLTAFQPPRAGRTLIAVRLGAIRLIDNMPWPDARPPIASIR
ncbi:MAG: pantoate--beta-alanine ligase [Phycisphaerales bacterium]|nr:pantoate--beta-alanine ligase [Phycisphaerales bacterium]